MTAGTRLVLKNTGKTAGAKNTHDIADLSIYKNDNSKVLTMPTDLKANDCNSKLPSAAC